MAGSLRKQLTFPSAASGFLVCYTAVFSVVTQRSSPLRRGALRDDTKNGFVADYWFPRETKRLRNKRSNSILDLQPRDKAAMVVHKTI